MIEYYAVYNKSTGNIEWKSSGPQGMAAAQELPDNLGVIVMPYEAFLALPDLGKLKSAVSDQVNAAVGVLRCRFITDVPGQQCTYLDKEAEARRWTADNTIELKYLTLEADKTGSTVAAVAALVIATADDWRTLNGKIEAARRGAVVAIEQANTIPAVIVAANVDWQAVVAS